MRFRESTGLLMMSLCLIMLAACSSVRHSQDGAPRNPIDLSHVQDATPRVEAKSRYGNPNSYKVFGKTYYVMPSSSGYQATGTASWYGTKFHGRRTSSGEPYDLYKMTAAHKSLPLPTYARVTNLTNRKSVIVKINDRGPFVDDRIIDLSYAAAHKLGMLAKGTARVSVEAINPREPMLATTPQLPQEEQDATSLDSNVYLQVGAFTTKLRAKALVSKLAQSGVNAIVDKDSLQERSIFKVQVGPIADKSRIEQLSEQLAKLTNATPLVVLQ